MICPHCNGTGTLNDQEPTMANFDAYLDDPPPRACQHAISFTRWCVDCFLLDVAIRAEEFTANPLCPDEVDDA